MAECYLVEKSCSRRVEERLLLAVENGKIKFHKGETREVFEIGENGFPFCKTWDGVSMPYLTRLLTEEQFKGWSILDNRYFSQRSERPLSAR